MTISFTYMIRKTVVSFLVVAVSLRHTTRWCCSGFVGKRNVVVTVVVLTRHSCRRRPFRCDALSLPPPQQPPPTVVIRYATHSDSSTSASMDLNERMDPLLQAMIQLQYTPEQCTTIQTQLQMVGLWENTMITTSTTNITTVQGHNVPSSTPSSSHHEPSFTLRTLTKDYMNQDSSTISTILIRDFQLPPLVAHQTRTALLYLHQQQQQNEEENAKVPVRENGNQLRKEEEDSTTTTTTSSSSNVPNQSLLVSDHDDNEPNPTSSWEQRYKSTIVRPIAQRRWAMCQTSTTSSATSNTDNKHMFAYSLQPIQDYPICQQELQEFYQFMTLPSTDSQEETPIRPATANIYIRHAKLFLGWYWNIHVPNHNQDRDKALLSLYVIFPTKDKVHANSILQYILWLRTTRYIAVSYEANLLRGLCKLLKFRYRKESFTESDTGMNNSHNNDGMNSHTAHDDATTTTSTTTSFNDIPVIRELRKLHRDANRRQAVAPRVSQEEHKWLSWPDYIQVVQRTKDDLWLELQDYKTTTHPAVMDHQKNLKQQQIQQRVLNTQRRRIAVLYQKYLILSFFANVPDRQRTIRELEIGRSFVRDNASHQWCIKHTPDDYKTGRTYGERPPLQLPTSLTMDIDDFIAQWRPALLQDNKNSNIQHLFLGPRTGTPLTSDAVYQTVSKTCYHYTGKRTNPHLLRDMIVTHVRESPSVTEQQLEALALYMGHSAAIQRKSYDRRTLTKKVAPAIALMEQVNADSRSTKEL
jgi:hypothetical protein